MSFSVRALVLRARAAPADQFAARLGPLVLLGPPTGSDEEGASGWRYLTEKGDTPLSNNPLGQLLEAHVYPLRKRSGAGAFGSVVLVGRAESNDVCLQHPSVSKLHARVETLDTGGLWLRDAQSRNGTYYDEHALAVDERVRVEVNHRIRFGDVSMSILDPLRLHGMLARLRMGVDPEDGPT